MIPKSANDKLRKFFEEEDRWNKFFAENPAPSFLEGKSLDNNLAAHWRPEFAAEDIEMLQQRLNEINEMTGSDRDATEAEREKIEALIADLILRRMG
ncbi:hypothetical protein AWB81_07426 [Caballeronia arationis]|uniref:hypothetical protein n=1 Tax=Caballeronia arationis TaxID=1777142 RepID=UPI00074B879E|nr:hypothetical protein [Caballeronia arationis]SAL06064.1 hypothetical protein AWB81_07426 [Caballeronia arationis]